MRLTTTLAIISCRIAFAPFSLWYLFLFDYSSPGRDYQQEMESQILITRHKHQCWTIKGENVPTSLTHQDLVVFRIARVDLPFELERRLSVLLLGTRQRVVMGTVFQGYRVPDTMPILRRRWAEHSRHFTTLIIYLIYDQTDGTCTPFQSKRLYLQPSD